MTIRVRVLYFGQARDASGTAEESRSLPERTHLNAALQAILSANPRLGKIGKNVQIALNEEIAAGDPELEDGDVIALLPPVAGG